MTTCHEPRHPPHAEPLDVADALERRRRGVPGLDCLLSEAARTIRHLEWKVKMLQKEKDGKHG